MELSLIDNVSFDGYYLSDYPDFSDVCILSADYNGVPMTEDQLNEINENSDFKHEKLIEYLF